MRLLVENIKYCPKCAHIEYLFTAPQNCKYCGHLLASVNFTYIEFCSELKQQGYSLDDALNLFEERYIAGNSEFSEEAREARLCEKRKQDLYRPISKTPNQVKCPYCQSVNVKKITTVGRAVSVGVFGIASGKIGKQWHCNNCKSDF